VARLFLDSVYKLHGLPELIISDRDRVFTSRFWKELFTVAQVQLHMSTAYHPQSDGQAERVNKCVKTFLRCFVSAYPKQWMKWLSLAEYWYNTSFHSAIGRSPFQALHGRSPRSFGLTAHQDILSVDLDQWLKERRVVTSLIKQHLERATAHMKAQLDKNRTGRQFLEGDCVFLKLQPYAQTSIAQRARQKLAFRFFGQIIQRIGQVAYKLKLPLSSMIHLVFHVSQLKVAKGGKHQVATLPTEFHGF
jgi:hypothetical protein